jgi:hypothetical protein
MENKQIRVRAIAQGFMGKLIESGEVFTVESAAAYAPSWMEKVDAETQESAPQSLKYGIKSNGGGRWIVVSNEDDSRASVAFKPDQGDAKALAQAEANRLNAGGTPVLESAPQSEEEQKADETLPDA